MSCPVAVAAVSAPTTIPFLSTNQRLAIVAAKTSAIDPAPVPTPIPQSAHKCHGCVIKIVEDELIATTMRADITTLRTVNRSMSAAANGATKPKSSTLIDTAKETCERDHPKASSSGTISTEGADLNPAVAIKVKKVTVAAIQPGWIFFDINYALRYCFKNSRSGSVSGRDFLVSIETAT